MAVTRRAMHVEDTRRALLDAARREFAACGYAGASLDDIARAAHVTKGALYHHFANKAALLEAVYVAMEEALVTRVTDAVAAARGDAGARIAAALDAFVDASAEPAYARIVLREAPLVIDRLHSRELDHRIGLGLVIQLVEGLRDERKLPTLPAAMTARVLLAAASDVVVAMAQAPDPEPVRREGLAVIRAMLDGLARVAQTA